jgi:hypothetical protein
MLIKTRYSRKGQNSPQKYVCQFFLNIEIGAELKVSDNLTQNRDILSYSNGEIPIGVRKYLEFLYNELPFKH